MLTKPIIKNNENVFVSHALISWFVLRFLFLNDSVEIHYFEIYHNDYAINLILFICICSFFLFLSKHFYVRHNDACSFHVCWFLFAQQMIDAVKDIFVIK